MFLVTSTSGVRKFPTIEEAYEEATKRALNSESVRIVHITTDGSVLISELEYYEAKEPPF